MALRATLTRTPSTTKLCSTRSAACSSPSWRREAWLPTRSTRPSDPPARSSGHMSADTGERLTEELAANAPDLLAYFERRTQPADAADLLAEVMLTAWRRIRELPDEPERVRMWL